MQPGDLMGCALRLAEVVHWVHMFWAGIPVPALQQRAAAASATVRGERKKVLLEFAKSKNILPTHAGKVYIAAKRAQVIRNFDGKEFVVSPTGEKVGQPLPDTQNPLKDILRK